MSGAKLHRSAVDAAQAFASGLPPGNTGLYWDRFFDQWSEGRPDSPRPSPPTESQEGGKRRWLDKFVGGQRVGEQCALDAYHQRLGRLVKARNGWHGELQLISSFVTGLGISHPIENGFLWHPTLGVPFLPDSSVKGMVRHFVDEFFLENPALPEACRENIARILGSPTDDPDGSVGSVAFLDAVPTASLQLEVAIVTPHRKEGLPPADWVEPTPTLFLAVAATPRTRFRFAIIPCPRIGLPFATAQTDVTTARKWLELALEYDGAGAKTATAYGRFVAP